MRSQIGPLLLNEIVKARHRKLPYFGLVIGGLLGLIIYVVAGQFMTAGAANAWSYTALSMQLIFTDLGLIFIIVFSAMLVSEETGTGTIRAALAAPLHRWELYIAKAITGFLYMVIMSVAILLLSMALAKIHYRFGAIGDTFGVVYSRERVCGEFLLAVVLSWIPLGTLVCYGLLVSTLVKSPGAAVAAGISIVYLIDFTKHLMGVDPYIFTRYITYPWQIIQLIAQGVDYQWYPQVWKMIGLSAASAFVLFSVGLIVFVRQDLND